MFDFSRLHLRGYVKKIRNWVQYKQLPRAISHTLAGDFGGNKFLLVTPDDYGSLGDAGMVQSVMENLEARPVDISKWTQRSVKEYPNTGSQFDLSKLRGNKAEKLLSRYTYVGCLGADVMDGLYSYADSCFRLRLVGLAADMGLNSRIFGFSINDHPHPKVVREFQKLHANVGIHVRDPISLNRLTKITDRPMTLVADLAFLVQASENTDSARSAIEWISQQRIFGKQVFGINIHPMFSFEYGKKVNDEMVASIAQLIACHREYSFVLIPHDFRPKFGDVEILQRVVNAAMLLNADNLYQLQALEDPAEVKGIVGYLDGVLTGRMHLAIAALGRNVPVAAITYQGKFEGLLAHFNLSDRCIISPVDVANYSIFSNFFMQWVTELASIENQVSYLLPNVIKLAQLNFSRL